MSYAIEMQKITKGFPGVLANDSIDLQVKKGEIHALVGENGAGKSTLMSILYGLYRPDSGEILINGKPVVMAMPRDSIKLGIGMVHQHFMLVPKLTVAENIIMGEEPGTSFRLDRKSAAQIVEKLSTQYGLHVDPYAKVRDISVAMQQRVEILKVLYRKAEILIMDEPTAVLAPQEIEEFCATLKLLTKKGKTIIFVSHKLDEVMAVSNNISVLRRGRKVGTVAAAETNPVALTRMMVGRDVELGGGQRVDAKSQDKVLSINQVSLVNQTGTKLLKNINLWVRRGEILGIAGVAGNGQQELVEVISGMIKPTEGQISLCGKDISNQSIRAIRELGMGLIPEDRHKHGLVLDYTIAENLILGRHYQAPFTNNGLFLNFGEIYKNATDQREKFDIRSAHIGVKAATLSGGNQQKIIIAREFSRDPELVVAVQPTRGLDIGAIEFVHQNLVEARNKGKGVLMVSLELDEVLALSDRIAVLYKGEIIGIIDAKEATREKLGLMMLGSREVYEPAKYQAISV